MRKVVVPIPICAFHSVNAGFYLWDGQSGLLVDGLHGGRNDGFSSTPPDLIRQLDDGCGLFAHLDGLLFTHLHPDHYDGALVRGVAKQLPLFSPELQRGAAADLVADGMRRFTFGGAQVICRSTIHDGAQYTAVPHCSYLVELGGGRLFFAGDGLLEPRDAEALLTHGGGAVDGVFLNLYQLAGRSGRDFLRVLEPRRVFLCHLPLPADDTFHYRAQAAFLIRSHPPDLPPVETLVPMHWIDGVKPGWA